MDRIKTSALVLIAVVASLMLLLTPDSFQPGVDVEVPAPGLQSPVAPFKHAEIQQLASKPGVPVNPRPAAAAIEKSQPNQVDNAPLILYPELAEIERMENWPSEEAFYTLQQMLSNHDPVIRLAAIESLGAMNYPGLQAALVLSLQDPNPQLQVAALEALASQEDESVVSSIEPYLFDQDREVRIAAIEALADLENEGALHSLAGLLSDQDMTVRHHAVNALGEIGGEYAIAYLLQVRFDSDETIRTNADAMLFELGYGAAD